MKRICTLLVAVLIVFGLSAQAQAVFIVDTGPGQAGSTQVSLYSQQVSFQHLGATFNVANPSTITSAEGWITGTGNVLFELHAGADPDGALLFSSLVGINDINSNWHGATGLNWAVAAGDYTLALIAQPGFIGGMETSPANPIGAEWFNNVVTGSWMQTTYNMGWRVDAVSASVPEPGAFLLLSAGLAGLIAARKRLS